MTCTLPTWAAGLPDHRRSTRHSGRSARTVGPGTRTRSVRIRRHATSRADGPGCRRPAVRHASPARRQLGRRCPRAGTGRPSSGRWRCLWPSGPAGQPGAIDEPARTSTVGRQQPSARRRPRVPWLQRSAASSRDTEQHGLHGDHKHGGVADRLRHSRTSGGDVPDKPSLLPGPALLPVTSPPWACPPLSCQAPATGKAQGAPSVRSLRRPGLLGPDARRSVGSKKIGCLAAPLNGWHRSPVCTGDPGHTWPGRHWRSSSCDWPPGPERSRLRASPP